ncbi:hypothetical protein BD310DRAFT_942683 [Dichomitus squalens]|uniref:Uncharacterized protein n=1 Tax=Dichomitus squalens TaxID=114155 RepID=A0A4Q9P948_9APHY|nr:hypothetical protein BD310DRAFT_942683 [Dichomitus squalens]
MHGHHFRVAGRPSLTQYDDLIRLYGCVTMATWRNGSAFGFDCLAYSRVMGTKRLQVRVLRWS